VEHFVTSFPAYKSVSHLLIQIFIAFIQVFMLQAPFIFNMDVGVEFPRQRLVQLYADKLKPDMWPHSSEHGFRKWCASAEFLQAELTSSSHWRCLSLRAISSGVSPASLAGAKTTVTIITVSPRRVSTNTQPTFFPPISLWHKQSVIRRFPTLNNSLVSLCIYYQAVLLIGSRKISVVRKSCRGLLAELWELNLKYISHTNILSLSLFVSLWMEMKTSVWERWFNPPDTFTFTNIFYPPGQFDPSN